MQITQFIRTNGIQALAQAPFFIKIKEYPEYGYYMLNYDQIESPKSHPYTIEARSLLVDSEGNVISRSFDRFFNYGECPDYYAEFDIARSVCYEKADGSLTKAYWSPATNQWELSTRSLAFAEGGHQSGRTFREEILAAMNLSEGEFQEVMKCANMHHTYIMEFIGPTNRIVTQYAQAEMVLLAVRNNQTGAYVDDSYLLSTAMNIRMAHTYALNDFESIIKAARDLPTLTEGYVCFDPHTGKRAKVKNPAYVAVHHLRENGTPSIKRIYSLVLMNEADEYLTYFECDRPIFAPAMEAVSKMKVHIEEVWERIKQITNQKEFALIATQYPFSSVLFNAKKKGTTALYEFDTLPTEKAVRLFV